MSTDKHSDVGYGRPPKESQFEKGRSGNPAGRPKKPKLFGKRILSILQKPVRVKEAGRIRHLPVLEAIMQIMINKALQGDGKAFREIILLAEKAGLVDLMQDANNPWTVYENEVKNARPKFLKLLEGAVRVANKRDEEQKKKEELAGLRTSEER